MCRGTIVLLASVLLQAPAMGQAVRAVVDCGKERLTGAERETCASPDLMRLTKDVDQRTGQLEGPTPASRIHGTIHDYPVRPKGPSLPAIFKTMTDEKATWFYDAKQPCSHWAGVVERHDSSLVLAQIEP